MILILASILGALSVTSIFIILYTSRLTKSINKKRVTFITNYKFQPYRKTTNSLNQINAEVRYFNKKLIEYLLIILLFSFMAIFGILFILNNLSELINFIRG